MEQDWVQVAVHAWDEHGACASKYCCWGESFDPSRYDWSRNTSTGHLIEIYGTQHWLTLSTWADEYPACAPHQDHYWSWVLSGSILVRASGSHHPLLVAVVGDGQSSPIFDLTLFPGISLLMTTILVISLVGCSSLFCDSFPYFLSL